MPAEPFINSSGENVQIYKTNCRGYPADYLRAKKRCPEQFVTLDSGRKLCYFADGAEGDPPMICLHGGGEGKWSWLQREPLPGIRMIALDRMGYGNSDLVDDVYAYGWPVS